jgi:hypothetical protein
MRGNVIYTAQEHATLRAAFAILTAKSLQLENTQAPVSTGASSCGRKARVSKKEQQKSATIVARRKMKFAQQSTSK